MQTILDTAEILLAERGHAGTTLKAIGERAAIPTASLYHYFADREHVDMELARRHLRALDAKLAAAVAISPGRSLVDVIAAILTELLEYFRASPGFVELWFGGRGPGVRALADEFDEMWSETVWCLLIERGFLASDTPQLAVRIAFEVGDRLFDAAFRRCAAGDDAVIEEGCRMLAGYLADYAPAGS